MKITTEKQTLGWGIVTAEGAEVWDTRPAVLAGGVQSWLKLLFYPKKFALYRYIKKNLPNGGRILDVGCGTGGSLIEMQRLFGEKYEVAGIDVVQLQIDLTVARLKEYGVQAEVSLYDGVNIVYPDASFDAIYTSDVLGHVQDVGAWLTELHRVLKPGGVLAMFSESALGRAALVRNYLLKRGVNVDPHAPFHISLFGKNELRQRITAAGFVIEKMYCALWLALFTHPEDFVAALEKEKRFPIIRAVSNTLWWIKKKLHPVSTALAELYSLVEMYTLGRVVESQGYVILGKKK